MKTKTIHSSKGDLTSIEHMGITRNYFITNIPKNGIRGGHAHKECQQYVYCVQGNFDITLDNKTQKSTYRMRPERGPLLVDKMVWSSLYNFSDECVVSVLATQHYDETDYIRDYATFLETN